MSPDLRPNRKQNQRTRVICDNTCLLGICVGVTVCMHESECILAVIYVLAKIIRNWAHTSTQMYPRHTCIGHLISNHQIIGEFGVLVKAPMSELNPKGSAPVNPMHQEDTCKAQINGSILNIANHANLLQISLLNETIFTPQCQTRSSSQSNTSKANMHHSMETDKSPTAPRCAASV